MKLLILILIFSSNVFADCPMVYGYDESGKFTKLKTRQESPLEPGICLMPRNATNLVPPTHEWKEVVFNKVSNVWELKDPDIGPNPNPLIYVRDTKASGEPYWKIDPDKKKAEDKKAEDKKAKEDKLKSDWDAFCANPQTTLDNLICREKGY